MPKLWARPVTARLRARPRIPRVLPWTSPPRRSMSPHWVNFAGAREGVRLRDAPGGRQQQGPGEVGRGHSFQASETIGRPHGVG